MGDGIGVKVCVGVGVMVGDGVEVGVCVTVAVGVAVLVWVAVYVGVLGALNHAAGFSCPLPKMMNKDIPQINSPAAAAARLMMSTGEELLAGKAGTAFFTGAA